MKNPTRYVITNFITVGTKSICEGMFGKYTYTYNIFFTCSYSIHKYVNVFNYILCWQMLLSENFKEPSYRLSELYLNERDWHFNYFAYKIWMMVLVPFIRIFFLFVSPLYISSARRNA